MGAAQDIARGAGIVGRARPEEVEDAEFVEIEPGLCAERPADGACPPSLVYEPRLRRTASGAVLEASYDDPTVRPWGFWGAAAVSVALIAFVAARGGAGGFFDIRDVLITVALLGLAVALYRFGPRERRRHAELAEIDAERAEIAWRSPQRSPSVTLPLAEITEVVFAAVRFPLSPSRPDAGIRVYTVLVRAGDGDELTAIIDATPDSEAAFDVARALSRLCRAPLAQVGEGVWGRM